MIYFVQAGQSGPIKIGFVDDPASLDARLGKLQTGNPEELVLLAVCPGLRDRECLFHARFASGRLVGEWFRPDTPGLHRLIFDAIQAEGLTLHGQRLPERYADLQDVPGGGI